MRIDWQQARALVATQLRIDLRHPKTGAARTSRALLTVAAYGCSSLLVALSLWSSNADVDAALFVGLSFATVLGAFSVAGAYDDLMGRPKDHAWALAFPVAERTHYVARLMNIGVLAFLAAGATALPLAALVGVLQGPAAAFGAGAAFVVALLGTTAAVLAALWVLTLATPYRLLRPAIAGLRGLLVVALVIGYQWVGTQEALVVEAAWWPAWWLLQGLWHADPAALVVLATAGAVLLALFGFAFPDRYFRLLRTLADGEAARQTRPRSHAAPNRLERLLVREPAARAA
ncbi:MAG: hypothetical protein R3362_05790, partial [Rhodothermales bacterium]|nr:hypothetical protein [Rhodothermales bacterium]